MGTNCIASSDEERKLCARAVDNTADRAHSGGCARRPLEFLVEKIGWIARHIVENSAKIFPIHRSSKFNAVIFKNGGSTTASRTAFMLHMLEEWEHTEDIATPYSRARANSSARRASLFSESSLVAE